MTVQAQARPAPSAGLGRLLGQTDILLPEKGVTGFHHLAAGSAAGAGLASERRLGRSA